MGGTQVSAGAPIIEPGACTQVVIERVRDTKAIERPKFRSKRQAGLMTWAAPAVMLALIVIIGIGSWQRSGVFGLQQRFEGAVMAVAKHIDVINPSEKYPAKKFLSVKFHMPVGLSRDIRSDGFVNNLRTNDSVWRWVLKYIGNGSTSISREIHLRAQPPMDMDYGCWRLPEIVKCHSPWLLKVESRSEIVIVRILRRYFSFSERSAALNVSAFSAFGSSIKSPHSDSTDHDQTVRKKNEGKVADLGFFAKPNFQNVAVTLIGAVIVGVGVFLLGSDVFAFIGVVLPCGVGIALYLPCGLLFWWAT